MVYLKHRMMQLLLEVKFVFLFYFHFLLFFFLYFFFEKIHDTLLVTYKLGYYCS